MIEKIEYLKYDGENQSKVKEFIRDTKFVNDCYVLFRKLNVGEYVVKWCSRENTITIANEDFIQQHFRR